MKQDQSIAKQDSNGVYPLIAILLLFVLSVIFIWLWYDLKIKELDREKDAVHAKP